MLDVIGGASFMLRWLERYAGGNVVIGVDSDPLALALREASRSRTGCTGVRHEPSVWQRRI